jgi:hypothetical protein
VIGSHTTPEEIFAFFTWLRENHIPTHNEEANRRVIEKYCERARAETRYQKDAETVLKHAEDLGAYIRRNDLHGSVYTAMLLQQDYMRLVLRQREPDAARGRIFRSPKNRKQDQLQTSWKEHFCI